MSNSEERRVRSSARALYGAVPKVIGSDTELGNIVIGGHPSRLGSGYAASRALLREVDGIAAGSSGMQIYAGTNSGYQPHFYYGYGHSTAGGSGFHDQDWGRKYLTNGGCCYIDLEHFEICTAEVSNARAFEAAWKAMLRISQQALLDANSRLPEGQQVVATANNSDRNNSSWGGHISLLVSRPLFDALCVDHVFLPQAFLMAYQCSSIIFTGGGKVGAENSRPHVPYQISQRADFFETLHGSQTTHQRPLINTRDEPLCGRRSSWSSGGPDIDAAENLARLHVIFYDTTLAPVSTFLKVGVLQIIVAICEAGYFDPNLRLLNPLDAVLRWSHDPDLRACSRNAAGMNVTAVEHQLQFLELAKGFVERGGCDGVVHEAEAIIALWEDTLLKLQQRDIDALATRLDWVAKRRVLEQIIERQNLGWDSPQIRHLDVIYSSLDPEEGIYWSLDRAGLMESVTTEEEIRYLMSDPPDDTRAWTRGKLLQRGGSEIVDQVNWDRVRWRIQEEGAGVAYRLFSLDNPLRHTRAETEQHFTAPHKLLDLAEALGAQALDLYQHPASPTVPTIGGGKSID